MRLSDVQFAERWSLSRRGGDPDRRVCQISSRPALRFLRTIVLRRSIPFGWLGRVLSIWIALGVLTASAAEYDLVIRNGNVLTGNGEAGIPSDVAIRDGRIAAVGKVDGTSKRSIDAEGLAVAPGFIDVHTHAENILKFPGAENFVRMGVTTVVMGNCGSSVADVAGLRDALSQTNPAVNVATLIGHGTVRSRVMGGSFMRPPTMEEMEQMKQMIGSAMENGALGMSTGLIYLPGTFATTEEIIELARVVGAFDGIYASHMRDEGDDVLGALEELIRITREAEVRGHVSHIKVGGQRNWGRSREVLAALERGREQGLRLTQDQYAYTASSTSLGSLIPEWAREGGGFSKRINDPEAKARMMSEMKRRMQERGHDYAYAVISDFETDPSLNGMNVREAAARVFQEDDLEAQMELIFKVQLEGGAGAVFHSMSEQDLKELQQDPHTMVAADSAVREFGRGVPHPRGYGNNARVLARHVREEGRLTLEEAVRRMTSLPAEVFGLGDRGRIEPGFHADLVVFDPESVRDNATFGDPHQYATGFRLVLVNGVPVVEADAATGSRPGRFLQRND